MTPSAAALFSCARRRWPLWAATPKPSPPTKLSCNNTHRSPLLWKNVSPTPGSPPATGRRPPTHCAGRQSCLRPQLGKVRLLDRLAGVLEGHGRWSQAASVYDEILAATETQAGARNRDDVEFDAILGYRVWTVYRVSYLYRAGIAYATAGDEEAAIARWRLALDEAPESNSAYQSLIQLVNRNVPVDLFLRGQIDLFAQAYFPAINAYERFLQEAPQDDRAGQAWLGLGRAYMGVGQWDEAIRALDQVQNWYPDCACFGDAWFTRAQLANAQGAPAAARRIYRTFARDHPDHPLAPEALWLSALSAIGAGRGLSTEPAGRAEDSADFLVEAVADLLMLVDTFPDSARAPDGLAVLGIGAFTYGHFGLAASSFERLLAGLSRCALGHFNLLAGPCPLCPRRD